MTYAVMFRVVEQVLGHKMGRKSRKPFSGVPLKTSPGKDKNKKLFVVIAHLE